jgi:D-glycero-D-manno-heptose 1,7-bisphosphate phosphatase
VINRDLPTAVRSTDEFELLPNAAKAIQLLNAAHIPVVVITNQALVARGVINEGELKTIHQHMNRLLAQEDAFLDDIIYCCDAEIEPNQRRKPAPGMLLEAMHKFKCAPESTVMIGDAIRDMQAAFTAQCQRILVKTGKGLTTLNDPMLAEYQPIKVYDDLYSAVLALLAT